MSNERKSRITEIGGFQFVFSSRIICRRGETPCPRQRGHIYVPEEFYNYEVEIVHVERRNPPPVVMSLNSSSSCFSCMRAPGVCVGKPEWRRIKDPLLEQKIIAVVDAHLRERRGQERAGR